MFNVNFVGQQVVHLPKVNKEIQRIVLPCSCGKETIIELPQYGPLENDIEEQQADAEILLAEFQVMTTEGEG